MTFIVNYFNKMFELIHFFLNITILVLENLCIGLNRGMIFACTKSMSVDTHTQRRREKNKKEKDKMKKQGREVRDRERVSGVL